MANGKVVEIEDVETWETTIEKTTDPVLARFYNPDCPHYYIMLPTFNPMPKNLKGK
jgi:hypothetical protein